MSLSQGTQHTNVTQPGYPTYKCHSARVPNIQMSLSQGTQHTNEQAKFPDYSIVYWVLTDITLHNMLS